MEEMIKKFKKLDVGEKEYTASMLGVDGSTFELIVRAYNTADALLKIKNSTEEGSKLTGLGILDEFGNYF
jgi:hypothetical protein